MDDNTGRPDIEVTSNEEETVGGLDPDSLDPNFVYRFVSDGNQKVARRLSRGYRFVRRSEDGVKRLYEGGEPDQDDYIRHGDTILMCIPKERHKQMEEKIASVTKARLAAPKGQFRKKAQGYGVEVTSRKMRGE